MAVLNNKSGALRFILWNPGNKKQQREKTKPLLNDNRKKRVGYNHATVAL